MRQPNQTRRPSSEGFANQTETNEATQLEGLDKANEARELGGVGEANEPTELRVLAKQTRQPCSQLREDVDRILEAKAKRFAIIQEIFSFLEGR